ncbi:S8 family serine peptidase [Nonomuraea turcica]|uniref:S8 family serine peptidase n=1 Tax=Nonomuraea sp. G32 TaxID=3067274 RepID=UPI00273CAEEE|nr:S8 family serine peptidase [Nonomuraea sp. G32]MDP4508332.1 S8 family serine peptidase [Nonomuraea sp. G32]
MNRNTRRWRAAIAGVLAAVALPLAAGPALADDDPTEAVQAKTEAQVLQELDKEEKAVYWVRLKDQANLLAAQQATDKVAKGEAVYAAKTQTAELTQKNLIALLDQEQVEYESFWIVNMVKVIGDAATLERIAELPEVAAIEADDEIAIDMPEPGKDEPSVNAVEWNISAVNAPRVWTELGVKGEGIVVANLDSGVDYTHPAVKSKYRGLNADGSYSHAYNFFDATGLCTGGVPCDNNGHGTHTMGTMVGESEDGANQIGVAPGAKWIATKGCGTSSCAREHLLAAGQWIAAPTDANGQNPRPDLAPDAVNNSWGADTVDLWYTQIVDSWVAAGIFPSFAIGNAGSSCGTAGSPGVYQQSYASGGFDSAGNVYTSSSRGPGINGDIKPDISAPAVNVRSSLPGGGYGSKTGTSMATPHTTATVALIWSYSPALRGNLAETRALLDQTALDVNNVTCGGTAADNNVWGQGKLDTYAAVSMAPHGQTGILAGKATSGGEPLSGVTLNIEGPIKRTVVTGADGAYESKNLSVGDYTITAIKFGYEKATMTATVLENQTVTKDIALTAAPSGKVSGTVRSRAGVAVGAAITVTGTPVTATTDAEGKYDLTLPLGNYSLELASPDLCASDATKAISVTGDITADINLADRVDSYGYTCTAGEEPWVEGTDPVTLTGDSSTATFTLPFTFNLYGTPYTSGRIGVNGGIVFNGTTLGSSNVTIPATGTPNAALYALWDDLYLDADSGVYTRVTGTSPRRTYVVEYRNAAFYNPRTARLSFEVLLGEDGSIGYRYKDIDPTVSRETGDQATIGIENHTGTVAFQYSLNKPVLSEGLSIDFKPTKTGILYGSVTDANDGEAVAGATVTVKSGETVAGTVTTLADGTYAAQYPAGDYQVELAAPHYESTTKTVTFEGAGVGEVSASLRTGAVAASLDSLEVVVPVAQTRTRTLELSNPGLGTAFTVEGATPWLTLTPATGNLATGGTTTLTLGIDTSAAERGTILETTLVVTSESGRAPTISIPVKVILPAYQAAIDSASNTSSVDAAGDTWYQDRAYTTTTGVGYLGSTSTKSTSRTIAGTDNQTVYRTNRQGMYEYRFDNVPNGTYTVELGFAEVESTKANKRVFDVLVEDVEVLPNLDIALKVGTYTAHARTFTTEVTDGQLNVRFVSSAGKPLVNAIRVTERADK